MNTRTLDDQQRATVLNRVFRRIGKLDDDSLIQLEALTRPVDSGHPLPPIALNPALGLRTGSGASVNPRTATQPMIPQGANRPGTLSPDQQSRRFFLVTLVAGAILATTAGGAAAVALSDDTVRRWLGSQGWLPTQTPQPPTATAIPTLPAEARIEIAALQSQMQSLQGQLASLGNERDGLQTQLNAANYNLTALQKANTEAHGLIELYRQLDNTNLDQIVVAALEALGVPVVAIETIREALNTGIAIAARVLQGVEDQMPLIAAGLDWLDQQVAALETGVKAFQNALQVSSTTPLAQAVTDFISTLLDLLPFGAGANIKTALQAMGDVIAKLPTLLDNVRIRLFEPARAWIVPDKTGGLYASLLKPIRDQLLAPAQQIVANAQNLNTVYNTQLAQPAQSALDQRAKIRAEITKKAGALPG